MAVLDILGAMSISRRSFVKGALAAIAGGGLLSSCQTRGQEKLSGGNRLNIYSWNDYLDPKVIPEFEKRTGIQVTFDTFASNEALIAKIEAGGSQYDVIVPTNYAVYKLKQLNKLQKIDKELVPNFKNVMERFRDPIFDRGCQYSIPYTFGTTGIAFNRTAYDSPKDYPRDWDAFWDTRLKGRLTLLEDVRETFGLALKRKGHSYNTKAEPLIKQACLDLIDQKKLVMCYSSDQVIIYLASGDALLSLAFSGDAHQATRSNADVQYIIPESGASMWIDNMAIPVGAPNRENAHKWMNFILEPEIAAANANYTYYAVPNQPALKLVKPQLLEDKTLYPTPELLNRCEEIVDVGDAIFLYDRYWTELKCV